MFKTLTFLIFLTVNFAFSFNYEMQTHAKREIIKSFPISQNKKFVAFALEGTWTDNLGNYGVMEQASHVILKNNDVIELDGYGKLIYQNKEETYFRGYRNQQEKDVGVGQTKTIHASKGLKSLIGMKCSYAVKFFNDTAFVYSKCKITEEQKKELSLLISN